MFSFAELERELKRDEGLSLEPYLDTRSVCTIAHGRTRYADGTPVSLSDPHITVAQAAEWLRADIFNAILVYQEVYPDYAEHPAVIANVLVNMAYNLGNKLRQFNRMNAAVARGDRKGMAEEMRSSNWYRQVGVRADRLVFKVLNG